MGTWASRTGDTARSAIAAAYDSSANLTYALDGLNNSDTNLSTVTGYSYGSNAWTTEASDPANSGSGREAVGAAYDSSANLTYSIDGSTPGGWTAQVYSYSHGSNSWTAQTSDTARTDLVAAYDSAANLTYATDGTLSGGGSDTNDHNAFSYLSNAWTAEAGDTANSGGGRDSLGEAYDSSANLTYAQSGQTYSGTPLNTNTAYSHGSNAWTTQAGDTADSSAGRLLQGCSYDSVANLTYGIDGLNGATNLSTVTGYSYGSNAWTTEASDTARYALASAYDSDDNYTIAIDGYTTVAVSTVTAYSNGLSKPTVVSELGLVFGATIGAMAAWVNPNGADTTVSFNYGATSSYGNSTGSVDIGAGTSPVLVSYTLTGLTLGQTVHFQASATNSVGTTNGTDTVFTTATAPGFSGILGQGLLGAGLLGNEGNQGASASVQAVSCFGTGQAGPASSISAGASVQATPAFASGQAQPAAVGSAVGAQAASAWSSAQAQPASVSGAVSVQAASAWASVQAQPAAVAGAVNLQAVPTWADGQARPASVLVVTSYSATPISAWASAQVRSPAVSIPASVQATSAWASAQAASIGIGIPVQATSAFASAQAPVPTVGAGADVQAVSGFASAQAQPASAAVTTTVVWRPSGQWGGGNWGSTDWGGASGSGAVSIQATSAWASAQTGPGATPVLPASVQAASGWASAQAAPNVAVFEGLIVQAVSAYASGQIGPATAVSVPASVQAVAASLTAQAQPATVVAFFNLQPTSAWASGQCAPGIKHGAAIATWSVNEEFEMAMSMSLEARGQLQIPVVVP